MDARHPGIMQLHMGFGDIVQHPHDAVRGNHYLADDAIPGRVDIRREKSVRSWGGVHHVCLEALIDLLIERQVWQIALCGTRPRGAFEAARWLSRIRVEEHGQPGNGTLIKLPFAAHITDPGREVGHHDQFLSQPGEICDMAQMHHTCRAFTAWERA